MGMAGTAATSAGALPRETHSGRGWALWLATVGRLAREGSVALEAVVRRPVVVVAAAAAMAMVLSIACSGRARPVWAGCATTLLVGVVGPWLLVASVRGRVAFDRERCRVGERVGVRSALRGLAGWNLGGDRGYFLHWPEGSGVGGGRLHGSPTGVEAAVTMVARGLQPRSAPRVCCDWPFGLVTAWRAVGVARRLVVRPVAWRLPLPLAMLSPSRHGRHRSEGARGSSGDILGVREYRRGDDPRSVHWVHTARRDTLVVRERPGHGLPVIRILLSAVDASPAELDTISTVATSLVESWFGQGVELDVAWGRLGREAVHDRRLPDSLLDAIACLDGPALAPPEGTLDRLLTRSDLAAGKPDLEVIVTNPALLGRGNGASAAPRLWIVVAAEAAAVPAGVSGTLGRGRLERLVVVPVGESASTGLLNLLAEVGHDPDAIGG